jgi:hypothetical protein
VKRATEELESRRKGRLGDGLDRKIADWIIDRRASAADSDNLRFPEVKSFCREK